jgi:hypothetical protein
VDDDPLGMRRLAYAALACQQRRPFGEHLESLTSVVR